MTALFALLKVFFGGFLDVLGSIPLRAMEALAGGMMAGAIGWLVCFNFYQVPALRADAAAWRSGAAERAAAIPKAVAALEARHAAEMKARDDIEFSLRQAAASAAGAAAAAQAQLLAERKSHDPATFGPDDCVFSSELRQRLDAAARAADLDGGTVTGAAIRPARAPDSGTADTAGNCITAAQLATWGLNLTSYIAVWGKRYDAWGEWWRQVSPQ